MRIKTIIISALIFSAGMGDYCKGVSKDDSGVLEIYLPGQISVVDSSVYLGQVCIVRGEESLVSKANSVKLGRFSQFGQELTFSRHMIMSRLACSGIDTSKVLLLGSLATKVRGNQQVIKSSKFIEAADHFLKKKLSKSSVCQWELANLVKDFTVFGESKDIKLLPYLHKSSAINYAKVGVRIFVDGVQSATREVKFRLKYYNRQVVSKVEISKGEVLSAANVEVKRIVSSHPEPGGWSVPYGLFSKRKLAANTVIHSGMTGPLERKILVKRNQNVIVRISRPGLFLEVSGKAYKQGRAGDYIEVDVKITDMTRRIMAKVNDDGSVEPVF